ncbi:Receptor-like protein kinase HSL1 [Hordeum vulgare]|nr:Receptor-like protein kinase HSL1 [Hordeum vulgare]
MDGDQANPGNAAVDAHPATKKKGPKAPRKPHSKCTPVEIAKLDADAVKRRGRRAKAAEMKAVAAYVVEADARCQARHLADVEEDSTITKAHALIMLGLTRPATAATSTGSSVGRPPQFRSPNSSNTPGPSPFSHGQTRFSTSLEGSMVAPATPTGVIDLNVTLGHGQTRFSSSLEGSMVAPATPTGVIDLNVTLGYSGAGYTSDGTQMLIKDSAKLKDQYAAHMADEGDLLKRPRGKTSSKADERRDASSIALQGTLENMMSQNRVRGERRSKGKEDQMKIYLELQTKKLVMEEAAERRKLDMEEATKSRNLHSEVAAQLKKLEIEATMANTKAKKVALALFSVEKTNVSSERKA